MITLSWEWALKQAMASAEAMALALRRPCAAGRTICVFLIIFSPLFLLLICLKNPSSCVNNAV